MESLVSTLTENKVKRLRRKVSSWLPNSDCHKSLCQGHRNDKATAALHGVYPPGCPSSNGPVTGATPVLDPWDQGASPTGPGAVLRGAPRQLLLASAPLMSAHCGACVPASMQLPMSLTLFGDSLCLSLSSTIPTRDPPVGNSVHYALKSFSCKKNLQN